MSAPEAPPQIPPTAAALRVALLVFATLGYMVLWTGLEGKATKVCCAVGETTERTHAWIQGREAHTSPNQIRSISLDRIDLAQHYEHLRSEVRRQHGEWEARLAPLAVILQQAQAVATINRSRTPAAKNIPSRTSLLVTVIQRAQSIPWANLVTGACDRLRAQVAERLRHQGETWLRLGAAHWQQAAKNFPRITHESTTTDSQTR